MIKVAIVGIGGRMGWEVAQQISLTNDIKLVGGVEYPLHPLCNTVLDEKQIGHAGVRVVDNLREFTNEIDMVIDFSSPDASIKSLLVAEEAKIGFISGTTNLSEQQLSLLRNAGETIPVLWSANMSIAVNLMYKLVSYCASQLHDSFDIGVLDIHHKMKKDAPSGTAKTLLSLTNCDANNVQALRLGNVTGDHTVFFCGNNERLEITHRSQSRAAFAEGTIRAARFIHKQLPGFYSMLDVLEGFETRD